MSHVTQDGKYQYSSQEAGQSVYNTCNNGVPKNESTCTCMLVKIIQFLNKNLIRETNFIDMEVDFTKYFSSKKKTIFQTVYNHT